METVKVYVPTEITNDFVTCLNEVLLYNIRLSLAKDDGIFVDFTDSKDDAFVFNCYDLDFYLNDVSFSQYVMCYLDNKVPTDVPNKPTVLVCVDELTQRHFVEALNSTVPGNVQVVVTDVKPDSQCYERFKFDLFSVYYDL